MSGRPKEYDDQAVIESAMNVFWNNGYEASGTQTLCEVTGLGRGSLYHAFGNKQGLYQKALRHYQEIGIHYQREILSADKPAKERLFDMLQWGISIDLDQDTPRGCLALHSVLERNFKDPEIQSINQHYLLRLATMIEKVIAEGVEKGEFTSDTDISTRAKAFLSGYYGLRIMGITMPDRDYLLQAAEGIVGKI
ncbi:TetR/AcrR family transcriptional regulator [Providencia sp. PROV132]|uniref:TetR/AcrR family transcriptional regulator n=1 Tax=Providencia sp. PROV132 TaxID=2949842 RepID=UPI00234AE369|nr:TetR/AcrR family transcriptional regulator [Providencia sp. PROV132]